MRQTVVVVILCFTSCAFIAFAQDEPSLGDAARQSRQQKQQKAAQGKDAQSKDAQAKDAPPAKKVITNDEMPEHASAPATTANQPRGASDSTSSGKMSAEHWKSQILGLKNMIASMQSEIDRLNDSIHFAPGNCVANCVQWNERQKEKQAEVERLQTQLEDQKKRLEDMQDTARQQGYGSSVYDP
jgi:predicted RNase H-like nuclease (RuvC/YqgF family)